MKKSTLFILALAFTLVFSTQFFAQAQRDIAVAGHNLNHPNNLALGSPNAVFNGWAGGNATFQVVTQNPPNSYMKNKLTGVQSNVCTVTLNILNAPSQIDFDVWGGSADLLMNGQGSFNVVCGATNLAGRFDRAILHVADGSNSASLTLLKNSVTYLAPTNLITNLPGNFAFTNGSLSIAMITNQPVLVNSVAQTISEFKAYANITFGARKI
jgi:hypothetical protein